MMDCAKQTRERMTEECVLRRLGVVREEGVAVKVCRDSHINGSPMVPTQCNSTVAITRTVAAQARSRCIQSCARRQCTQVSIAVRYAERLRCKQN